MGSDIQIHLNNHPDMPFWIVLCFKFTTQHSILFALKESKMNSNQTIEKQTAHTVVFSPTYLKGT